MDKNCSLSPNDFENRAQPQYAAPIKSMSFTKFQRVLSKINLKAAGMLLVFMLSWVAAPASLLAQQPDVCSMECCVAEGHCCCAAPKLWVEGQDHGGIREIGTTEIESSCPCPVTPPSGVKKLSRQTARTVSHDLTGDGTNQPVLHKHPSVYDSLRFTPKSPRAPPSFS